MSLVHSPALFLRKWTSFVMLELGDIGSLGVTSSVSHCTISSSHYSTNASWTGISVLDFVIVDIFVDLELFDMTSCDGDTGSPSDAPLFECIQVYHNHNGKCV